MKKYVFISVCILIYMFYIPAYSANGELIDITKQMHLVVYDNSFPLDKRIRCVAVDSYGNVAVRSGSSQDSCDYIISVYDKIGEFLYGYEVTFKNQRGYGVLFFDGEDRLCYSATFSSESNSSQNILIIFDPHSIGYTSYTLEEKNYFSEGAVKYVDNIPVFISEHAQYTIAYCTECTFGIKDIQTDQIYDSYDQLAAYNIAVENQNKMNILIVLLSTVFILSLGVFLSWAHNNRNN